MEDTINNLDTWLHLTGLVGAIAILSAYFLVQLQYSKPYDYLTLGLNISGASFVLISMFAGFNLGSFIINSTWIVIALMGFYQRLRKPTSHRAKSSSNLTN